MRIITRDDFTDIYVKLRQRGFSFLLSKLRLSGNARTASANEKSIDGTANWWIIPSLRRDWNRAVTGSRDKCAEDYIREKYFSGKTNLKILAPGSGSCSHEILIASYPEVSEILCIEISGKTLEEVKLSAKKEEAGKIIFRQGDANVIELPENFYDAAVFFNSLHHFRDMENFISNKIKRSLKPGGLLIMDEYVGPDRLCLPQEQIRAVNSALSIIPGKFRIRHKTNLEKKAFSGSGFLRMLAADPSECAESSKILPALREHFEILEETPRGGNILMHALKDIAHHFAGDDQEAAEVLSKLKEQEAKYLKSHESDFVFGVYRKPSSGF
ncbi:MAG: class I SAM-dependent methyltransferase [Fibrobacterota bacterium]